MYAAHMQKLPSQYFAAIADREQTSPDTGYAYMAGFCEANP
jgi:hypothetical protein